MAVRKAGGPRSGTKRKKVAPKTASKGGGPRGSQGRGRVPVATIFWVLFFVVLITAFFALLPTVKKGASERSIADLVAKPPAEAPAPAKQPAAPEPAKSPEKAPTPPPAKPPESPPASPSASQPAPPPLSTPPTNPPAATPPPAEKPAETRDRSVYFMQETKGGAELLLVKANRKLPVSDSPLFDSLNALLAGPTADEKTRGIINLIPSGTRIIAKPQIRGNTAIIDFNEEFQYNPDGREGLTAQLKQIVWTATEFPNVHDVQILIEGQRVNFLSEGIMIGSPLRR